MNPISSTLAGSPDWLDSNLFAHNPDYRTYVLARMTGRTQADTFEAWGRGEDAPAKPVEAVPVHAPVAAAVQTPVQKPIKRKPVRPVAPEQSASAGQSKPDPKLDAPPSLKQAVVNQAAHRTFEGYRSPTVETLPSADEATSAQLPEPPKVDAVRAEPPRPAPSPSSGGSSGGSSSGSHTSSPKLSHGSTPVSETPPTPPTPPESTPNVGLTPAWIAEKRLPTFEDFDQVRYMSDENYRSYVQLACSGKTRAPNFEEFAQKSAQDAADQKWLPMEHPPLVFGNDPNYNYLADNAYRIQVYNQTNARIAARNRAIDMRKEAAGNSSRMMTMDMKAFVEGRVNPPPFNVAMDDAGMNEELYLTTLNQLRETYHTTRSKNDWGKIGDQVAMGIMTFGIGALTLLDKDSRKKSGVKENAVQQHLNRVNKVWRQLEIPAQWHLEMAPGWPKTWELSLHRSPTSN